MHTDSLHPLQTCHRLPCGRAQSTRQANNSYEAVILRLMLYILFDYINKTYNFLLFHKEIQHQTYVF